MLRRRTRRWRQPEPRGPAGSRSSCCGGPAFARPDSRSARSWCWHGGGRHAGQVALEHGGGIGRVTGGVGEIDAPEDPVGSDAVALRHTNRVGEEAPQAMLAHVLAGQALQPVEAVHTVREVLVALAMV